MVWELRALLFVGALLTLLYFLRQIQKNRLQIDFAIFWSMFAFALFLLGMFPGVIIWASKLAGFESPANMVFLLIIFVLTIKLFTNTVKLSKMSRQITEMAQQMAIRDALSKTNKAENSAEEPGK